MNRLYMLQFPMKAILISSMDQFMLWEGPMLNLLMIREKYKKKYPLENLHSKMEVLWKNHLRNKMINIKLWALKMKETQRLMQSSVSRMVNLDNLFHNQCNFLFFTMMTILNLSSQQSVSRMWRWLSLLEQF